MTSARQYEQTIRERRNLALLAEEGEPKAATGFPEVVLPVSQAAASEPASSSVSSDSLLTLAPVVRPVRAGVTRVVV